MKNKEKKLARDLRKKGWSMNEIKRKVKVSKSSVSLWVRDIELTRKQKQELSKKGIKKEVIEQRRITRLKREKVRRQDIVDRAKNEIKSLKIKDLNLIGISLYWAEGAKTRRSGVQFSNSDPRMIQLMIEFLMRCCNVSKKRLRGRVFIHPHLDIKKAEKYWQKISGIPLNQFYKPAIKQSKASKNKKDNLPFGTFNIQICNTELLLSLRGWSQGIYEKVLKL